MSCNLFSIYHVNREQWLCLAISPQLKDVIWIGGIENILKPSGDEKYYAHWSLDDVIEVFDDIVMWHAGKSKNLRLHDLQYLYIVPLIYGGGVFFPDFTESEKFGDKQCM